MDDHEYIDANTSSEISAMSEVDIPEEMPNGDDSAFVSEQQHHETHGPNGHPHQLSVQTTDGQQGISAEHVYVATTQGLLTAEQLQQAGIKTTHIVIHDQGQETTLAESITLPKSPSTPLPPPTPATPNSRERGWRYTWDDTVQQPILPVRCKSSNGELHKAKFGSGDFFMFPDQH